jgi:dipeptidyl aminopeptidase/acylaminoacyl peptidase
MLLKPFGCRAPARPPPSIRGLVLAVLLFALGAPAGGATAAPKDAPGPTVKEVVEFTRIIQPRDHDNDALRAQVSPDRRHAFIVTRKADVKTDKNLFEILLLDVRLERLVARQRALPRRLLRVEAAQDEYYAEPFIQDARWVGNRTIVFRGRVHDAPVQVYKLDVVTRQLTQLTFGTPRVVSFAVSRDQGRVVYVAQVPNPAMPPGARSVVVANHSFWSVKFGQDDLRAQNRRYQYFVAESGSRQPARALGQPFDESSGFEPGVSISPDGRWALLPRYEPERQLEWARQYPMVADATANIGPSLTMDPLGYFSRPFAYVARRMVAYRLSDGREQTVIDAPDDAMVGLGQVRSDRLWQGKGKSVVLAGTHLPLQAGREAASGSHIIEYWPDTGRWEVIAALNGRLRAAYAMGDQRDGFMAIDGDRRRYFERGVDGRWHERDVGGTSAGGAATSGLLRGGWDLRVEEGLNQPADLVASGPDGQNMRLTRLNPQFSAETWGSMRPYPWQDPKGRQWDGGLMVPPGIEPGTRHVLVIQTYGFSASRFYLDGPNVADGYTSGFAGRAFLRENILVLAMPWRPSSGAPDDAHGGVLAFMDGVQGAIDALVRDGLVDPERVGIMGWSATGERVLNLVTFSSTPIRAATLLDGDANTLFSLAVTYGASDSTVARKERTNEGRPFGESLDRWVRNDPALHTDCVKAALRIETYGPWVLNNWDIYALLRRQYKPAEMIVIPGGAHSLSRPGERMISLQGNVDWYRFWLKDEERSAVVLSGESEETLRAQYARWRQMAELKRADDAKPRCARQDGAR